MNIFVQNFNWLIVKGMRNVEKLCFKRGQFKGRIELGVISSSFPENLALEIKDSLKFFLDILQRIFVELILIGNGGVILFHSFSNHLIVLVIGIDHDESGSIGLQLLHQLKIVFKIAFILTSAYFIL